MAFKPVLPMLSFFMVYVMAHYNQPNHQSTGNGNAVHQDINYEHEVVRVDVYYESLCPDCIAEYPQLPPLVKRLGDQVDLHTYPYGNARMRQKDGKTTVKCQHGEAECYGNKLHACSIDLLNSVPAYINYNACLMSARSNDTAADTCGEILQIDSEPIKNCAKGDRGFKLLVYYGMESQKVIYPGVPYVLINGKELGDETILDAVCAVFLNPPKECDKSIMDVKII